MQSPLVTLEPSEAGYTILGESMAPCPPAGPSRWNLRVIAAAASSSSANASLSSSSSKKNINASSDSVQTGQVSWEFKGAHGVVDLDGVITPSTRDPLVFRTLARVREPTPCSFLAVFSKPDRSPAQRFRLEVWDGESLLASAEGCNYVRIPAFLVRPNEKEGRGKSAVEVVHKYAIQAIAVLDPADRTHIAIDDSDDADKDKEKEKEEKNDSNSSSVNIQVVQSSEAEKEKEDHDKEKELQVRDRDRELGHSPSNVDESSSNMGRRVRKGRRDRDRDREKDRDGKESRDGDITPLDGMSLSASMHSSSIPGFGGAAITDPSLGLHEIAWKLFVAHPQIGLGTAPPVPDLRKDTEGEERRSEIKTKWEKADPGRAKRAAASREKFLSEHFGVSSRDKDKDKDKEKDRERERVGGGGVSGRSEYQYRDRDRPGGSRGGGGGGGKDSARGRKKDRERDRDRDKDASHVGSGGLTRPDSSSAGAGGLGLGNTVDEGNANEISEREKIVNGVDDNPKDLMVLAGRQPVLKTEEFIMERAKQKEEERKAFLEQRALVEKSREVEKEARKAASDFIFSELNTWRVDRFHSWREVGGQMDALRQKIYATELDRRRKELGLAAGEGLEEGKSKSVKLVGSGDMDAELDVDAVDTFLTPQDFRGRSDVGATRGGKTPRRDKEKAEREREREKEKENEQRRERRKNRAGRRVQHA